MIYDLPLSAFLFVPFLHMGNLSPLEIIGPFDLLIESAKKRGLRYPKHLHEPPLSLLVALDRAVIHDVVDLNMGRPKVAADQNGPVAEERVLFGTHQADAVGLHPPLQPAKAFLERSSLRYEIELDLACPEAGRVIASGAKLCAKKDILKTALLQVCFEGFAVELGVVAAVRVRPDIGQGRNGILTEQLDEQVQSVGGVSYRIDVCGLFLDHFPGVRCGQGQAPASAWPCLTVLMPREGSTVF